MCLKTVKLRAIAPWRQQPQEKNPVTLNKQNAMNRSSKILTGILSFLPIILGVVIIFQVFSLFPNFFQWDEHEPDPYTVFSTMWPVFMTGIIAAIVGLGALIFFIVHMLNNKRVETNERIIWILVFIFTGSIGFPIYWYMRIWKTENEER